MVIFGEQCQPLFDCFNIDMFASVIRAYIEYHLKRDPTWNPKAVSKETPMHIRNFIQQKCGKKSEGYEGCHVCFILCFS